MPKMNVNAFSQKDYENEPPFGPKKTNPNKPNFKAFCKKGGILMPRLGQLVFYTSKGHPWVGIKISAFVCIFFSCRFRITAVANNTTGWVTESLALNEYFLHHLGIWITDWFDTIVTLTHQRPRGPGSGAKYLRLCAG